MASLMCWSSEGKSWMPEIIKIICSSAIIGGYSEINGATIICFLTNVTKPSCFFFKCIRGEIPRSDSSGLVNCKMMNVHCGPWGEEKDVILPDVLWRDVRASHSHKKLIHCYVFQSNDGSEHRSWIT